MVNRLNLRVIFSVIAIFLLPVLAWADLRDQVCVVRPNLEQDIKDSFNKLATSLEKDDDKDLADFFRSYAQGGFGSGFLVSDPSGRVWVVTNRHVVAMANSADIEFQKSDGSVVTYKVLPLVYMDDATDLAFLAFPKNVNPASGTLKLAPSKIDDGAEVWSAGYPALLDQATWQLGKGTVTNSHVSVAELANSDGSWFIQHSATIDHGNSGGPLLVKNGDVYSVLGVNSFSLLDRQNTFFSIPSDSISGLLTVAATNLDIGPAQIDDALAGTAKAFAQALNGVGADAVSDFKYISYSDASKNGWSDFVIVENTLSQDESDSWHKRMRGGLPIEIMRQAAWEKLRIAFSRTYADNNLNINFDKIIVAPNDSPVGRTARVGFSIQGKAFTTDWKWEGGHWRLLETDISGVVGAKVLEPDAKRAAKAASESDNSSDDSLPVNDKRSLFAITALAGLGLDLVKDSSSPPDSSFVWDAGLEFGTQNGTLRVSSLLHVWSMSAMETIDPGFYAQEQLVQIIGLGYMYRVFGLFGAESAAFHGTLGGGIGGSISPQVIFTLDGEFGGGIEFGKPGQFQFGIQAMLDASFVPLATNQNILLRVAPSVYANF